MSLMLFIKTLIMKRDTVIMFESSPDLSSNTYPVYLEFLNRGFNKHHYLLWKVRTNNRYPRIKNVVYWNEKMKYNLFKKTFFHFLFKHVKVKICCNGFLLPTNSRQVSFYLTHGTFIKNVSQYYNIPHEINYVLVASEEAGRIISKTTKYPYLNRIIATGYPYNDDLTNTSIDLKTIFGNGYDHFIVWYPTYKQHKNSKLASTTGKAISIIDNEVNANIINKKLIAEKTLLIIKPHFAQDTTRIYNYNLSNIVFIDDTFFTKHKITSYSFIAACDSLITDYSAVYFDYLLCDKPIAAVWEDIDEYKKFPGFCIDINKAMEGAVKIYKTDDFISFIDDVSNGKDMLKQIREKLCSIYNLSRDGKNTKRVVEFIIEKSGLKP